MSLAKCPKCDSAIRDIVAVPVNVKDGTSSWKGGVYTCPHCSSILGAGLDPLALIEETVRRLRSPDGR